MSLKTNKILRICLLCIVGILPRLGEAQDFAINYPEEYQKAMSFYVQNTQLWNRLASQTGENPYFLFAIVAPEIAFYNSFVDRAETRLNTAVYVQFGADYANFSVGQFQMKPTFAEAVETDARLLKLEGFDNFFPTDSNANLRRKKRCELLQSAQTQLRYLQAMIEILKHKHPSWAQKDETERLRLLATAYNRGYRCQEMVLRACMALVQFPARTLKPRYNYADLALFFYAEGMRQRH